MDKKNLKISLAARCNAAGRPNNEDNFQISSDLSCDKWQFIADDVFELGGKGILLVVCDGMGGMNAGEVASEIAVETIKTCFASENITDDVVSSDASIRRFIINSIQTADAAIKKHGDDFPETAGMGSTIVLVWIYSQKAYVGWCGDSRAYRYNSVNGIERLSHDHSYVQELVDAGKLSEELAFDHPNSNIITRSLGDPNGKAKPDFKAFVVNEGDIFLLCSDGLCGTLRDEEISAVIRDNSSSMQKCCDALWVADEKAGWTDNVTTLLAKVEGEVAAPTAESKKNANKGPFSSNEIRLKKRIRILMTIIGVFLAISFFAVGVFLCNRYGLVCINHNDEADTLKTIEKSDTSTLFEETECAIRNVCYNSKNGLHDVPRGSEFDIVSFAGGEYSFSIEKVGDGDLSLFCDKKEEILSGSSLNNEGFSLKFKANNTDTIRRGKITLKCNDKEKFYFFVIQRPNKGAAKADTLVN